MNSITDYLAQVDDERKPAFTQLYQTIKQNIPPQFSEQLIYGQIGFVVPKTIYPSGYHCTPELPLPFVTIAAQKSHLALYHMGIYMLPDVYDWFVAEYPNHSKRKLDMGKSCVRFKKTDDIPFDLIAQLMQKIPLETYVATYEAILNKPKK